ncbi:MAG: hypothetical protein WBG34_15430 [Flavobacteriales bacterium]
MRELVHSLSLLIADFEAWFDLRFGWFFTNGMKSRAAERPEPEVPAHKSVSPRS